MSDLHGRLLHGRYRIERRLGEGGTGIVWLVADTREKGHVWALKELDFEGVASMTERAEAVSLFERESDMLMHLSHPALPQVVDRFSEGGRQYLVMERVEGPTLDQALKRRGAPLDEADVAGWLAQVCDVLAYLHGRVPPVVYRDLKPANIMLSVDGRVKLIDFGIARPLNPLRPGDTTAYGTPGYAPPEQYAGSAVPASDIYALGVTAYQLLTACDPQAPGFRLSPARNLNSAVTTEMAELVSACTQTVAEARPSVCDVRAVLERLRARPRTRASLFDRLVRLMGLG